MKITERTGAEGFQVLRLSGHLDTKTGPVLEERLLEIEDAGTDRILIDCSDLEYVASTGLRVILAAAKRAGASGGMFRLCSMSDFVREVFDLTGFSKIIEIYDSEQDAVSSGV